MPSIRYLHFVQGKRLASPGTGSFGRGPRKSALPQILYSLDKQMGIHPDEIRDGTRYQPELSLSRLPRPGSHARRSHAGNPMNQKPFGGRHGRMRLQFGAFGGNTELDTTRGSD